MSSKYQEALAAAASNAERARLAEWDAGLLRGQIGLAQQDLTIALDSPSSSSAVPGGNASSSRPALMSPCMGSTSPVYAASGDRGAGGTPAANRGSPVRTFTSSKPGDGLRAFADNASVTVVNPSGDALTTVASTLLKAKAVHLEG